MTGVCHTRHPKKNEPWHICWLSVTLLNISCNVLFYLLGVKVQKNTPKSNNWWINIGAKSFSEVIHFYLVALLKHDKVKL
jgi:hypothetical protein